MPFPNFWKSKLCHGAAFLVNNAQLALVWCTVDKKIKHIREIRNLKMVTIYSSALYIYCDGKFTRIPKRDSTFRPCEDGAHWHLIPCRISLRLEFFLGHIGTGMWGINLWPRLTAVGKGFPNFTLHTHPPRPLVLPPLEQWKIWTSRFRSNNINYSSRQLRFPV